MSDGIPRSEMPRQSARILILDDEPANVEFLRHVLAPEGYGLLLEHTNAAEALDRFEELAPDLILLDLMMPGCDGFQFMERVRKQVDPHAYLPILVATADTSAETRRRALSAGARDFLTKPLSPADVRLRVRNLLQTRFLHEQLRQYNHLLEERVGERTRELEEARLEILDRLARAAEYRDDDTGQHTQRVGRLAARLARILKRDPEEVELIRRAAPLHDVGKIGIPDSILLKAGRLTVEEREVMQTHAQIGASILAGSRYPLLQLAEQIAISHHERWDGKGYPAGKGEGEVPLAGRIVAVADVFDSLTHERPYKHAWSKKEAFAEIEKQSGSQFDPAVVEALLRVAPEIHLLETTMAEPVPAAAIGSRNGTAAVAGTPAWARPSTAAGPSPNRSSAVRGNGNGTGALTDHATLAGAFVGDALTARVRTLEMERKELSREIRNLKRKLARREARIAELGPTEE